MSVLKEWLGGDDPESLIDGGAVDPLHRGDGQTGLFKRELARDPAVALAAHGRGTEPTAQQAVREGGGDQAPEAARARRSRRKRPKPKAKPKPVAKVKPREDPAADDARRAARRLAGSAPSSLGDADADADADPDADAGRHADPDARRRPPRRTR